MAHLDPHLQAFYLMHATNSLNQITLLALDHYLSTTLHSGSLSSIVSKLLICFLTVLFTVGETYSIDDHDKTFYSIAYMANFSQTIGAILYQSKTGNKKSASHGIAWTLLDVLRTFFIARFLKCEIEVLAHFLVLTAFARTHGPLWLVRKTLRLLRLQTRHLIQTPAILVDLVTLWTLSVYVFAYSHCCRVVRFVREAYPIWSALVPVVLMEMDRIRGDFDTDEEEELEQARRRLRRVVWGRPRGAPGADDG